MKLAGEPREWFAKTHRDVECVLYGMIRMLIDFNIARITDKENISSTGMSNVFCMV